MVLLNCFLGAIVFWFLREVLREHLSGPYSTLRLFDKTLRSALAPVQTLLHHKRAQGDLVLSPLKFLLAWINIFLLFFTALRLAANNLYVGTPYELATLWIIPTLVAGKICKPPHKSYNQAVISARLLGGILIVVGAALTCTTFQLHHPYVNNTIDFLIFLLLIQVSWSTIQGGPRQNGFNRFEQTVMGVSEINQFFVLVLYFKRFTALDFLGSINLYVIACFGISVWIFTIIRNQTFTKLTYNGLQSLKISLLGYLLIGKICFYFLSGQR